MKRITALFLILSMTVLFSACTENRKPDPSESTSEFSEKSVHTEHSTEEQQSSEISANSMPENSNDNQQSSQAVSEGSIDMKKLPQIEKITMTVNGSMAYTTEYEVLRTENGVTVSKYEGPWNYHDDTTREDFLDMRKEGDEDLYNQICKAASDCGVKSWDGFSRSFSDVCDGESISVNATIDGKAISAHGYVAKPDGYREFVQILNDILSS